MSKFFTFAMLIIALCFGVATIAAPQSVSASSVATCVATMPVFTGSTSVRDDAIQTITTTTFVENLTVVSNCGNTVLLPAVAVDGEFTAYTPAQVHTAIASWVATNDVIGNTHAVVASNDVVTLWTLTNVGMFLFVVAVLLDLLAMMVGYEIVTGSSVNVYMSALTNLWCAPVNSTTASWDGAYQWFEVMTETNEGYAAVWQYEDWENFGDIERLDAPAADNRYELMLMAAIADCGYYNNDTIWLLKNHHQIIFNTMKLEYVKKMHKSICREIRLINKLDKLTDDLSLVRLVTLQDIRTDLGCMIVNLTPVITCDAIEATAEDITVAAAIGKYYEDDARIYKCFLDDDSN